MGVYSIYSVCLVLACCCIMGSAVSGTSLRSHFDKLRAGNCTSCQERLQINVAEVLPRLSLIKQQIMKALGKSAEDEPRRKTIERPRKPDLAKTLPNSATRPRSYGVNEIVSVSRNINHQENETIIRFQIRKNSIDANSEAIGASLLLFLDRKRRMRKGGRGKKVFIEISSRPHVGNETWSVLAFFRTRVKRRRWKSISLPLNIAQRLLLPDVDHVDLKVKCTGCGRLVELVLDKDRAKHKKVKVKVNEKNKVKRHGIKKRKHRVREKSRKQANPMLVIGTRYSIH